MVTRKQKLRDIKKFVIEQIKDEQNHWTWKEYDKCYKCKYFKIYKKDKIYSIDLKNSDYVAERISLSDIGLSEFRLRRLIRKYIDRSILDREKNEKIDDIIGSFDKLLDSNKELKRDTNINKVLDDK